MVLPQKNPSENQELQEFLSQEMLLDPVFKNHRRSQLQLLQHLIKKFHWSNNEHFCQDPESSLCCHFNYIFILDSFQNTIKLYKNELNAVLPMLDCELELNLVFQPSLCIARERNTPHTLMVSRKDSKS